MSYQHLTGQIVIVQWHDVQGGSGWKSESEVKDLQPWSFTTISKLVFATDDYIVLADTWDCSEEEVTYGSTNCIPTGCISDIRVVSP